MGNSTKSCVVLNDTFLSRNDTFFYEVIKYSFYLGYFGIYFYDIGGSLVKFGFKITVFCFSAYALIPIPIRFLLLASLGIKILSLFETYSLIELGLFFLLDLVSNRRFSRGLFEFIF